MEPDIEEFKWFCPGVGLAREEDATGVNELVSITTVAAPASPAASAGAPTAAAPTARPATAPATGTGGDSDGSRWLLVVPMVLVGVAVLAVAAGTAARRTRG